VPQRAAVVAEAQPGAVEAAAQVAGRVGAAAATDWARPAAAGADRWLAPLARGELAPLARGEEDGWPCIPVAIGKAVATGA
jgi:hypothetical protein